MNILFIIIAAALAAGAIWGWKRGMIAGIVRIISGILGIIVLLAVAQGIEGYIKGNTLSIVMVILIMVIIGIIQKFVKFITGTFRLIRAIPIGKLADKAAGAVLGAAEVLCIVWVMFILAGSFELFGLEQWLLEQVEQSVFLQIIYNTNYLVVLLQWFFAQLQ